MALAIGPRPADRPARGGSPIPDELTKLSRDKAKKSIINGAESSGILASLAFQWYGVYNRGWIDDFGVDVFGRTFLQDSSFRDLTWIALAATEAYGSFSRPPDLRKATAVKFLSDLGSAVSEEVLDGSIGRESIGPHIPLEVWQAIFAEVKEVPEAVRGVLLIFALSHPGLSFKGDELPPRAGPAPKSTRRVLAKLAQATYEGANVEFQKILDAAVSKADSAFIGPIAKTH